MSSLHLSRLNAAEKYSPVFFVFFFPEKLLTFLVILKIHRVFIYSDFTAMI